jgi:hypothetical protein
MFELVQDHFYIGYNSHRVTGLCNSEDERAHTVASFVAPRLGVDLTLKCVRIHWHRKSVLLK